MVETLSELNGTLSRWGEFVSNVVEILSELPKALSNPLKTLSEWGCVASCWPGRAWLVSAEADNFASGCDALWDGQLNRW